MNSTKKSGSHALITPILVWSGLAVMSSMYVTIPLISIFSQSFSVPESQTAWVSSIYSFFFALGGLIYGPLSDKLGRKRVISTGMLILAITSLLLGFAQTLPMIIFLRALQGAAAASFPPVALSYVTESYPAHKKISTVGFISTGFLIAGIVGQVFSGFIYTHAGWNYIFTILAIVYALTAAMIIIFVPGYPPSTSGIGAAFRQMSAILKQRRLIYVYVAAAIALLSFVGMYTALGSYLSNKFGLNTAQILYVRSAGIVGMLLSPFTGRLAKRFGLVATLRNALIVSIIGLLILASGLNLTIMVIASVIFVSGIAITIPSLISLVGELGGAARGMAISMYTFILFFGASVGPMLATYVLNAGNYVITFLVLALCVLIGAIATLFVKMPVADESKNPVFQEKI